jgi:3-hydroxyacyl-CoA dehydrogenase
MVRAINKAAVLGAGVMGSGIAALLAGVGVEVKLLDVVPKELDEKEIKKGLTTESTEFRNRIAQAALDRITNPKAGILFHKDQARLISIGNMSDNMDMLADCDWIIEVVVENLSVKKQLMANVARYRKPGCIVSTNTSGVSIAAIVEDLPQNFREHFLGTHFFNPPRMMRLFELIPTPDTSPELLAFMQHYGQNVLGKGIVLAKDTPNFIGNRIGVYALVNSIQKMLKYNLDIPTMDQITGVVLGRPKSATFRTLDMVGIDVFASVANNVITSIDDAVEQVAYAVPEFVRGLIAMGSLGDKSRKGFYRKNDVNGRKINFFWNEQTGSYEELKSVELEGIQKALQSKNKYAEMIYGEALESKVAWEHIKDILLYSAAKVPEITDDFTMIDKAMVWGYNWEKGPFQIWDAIGLEKSVVKMKAEGETIPIWVEEKLAAGEARFYYGEENNAPYINLNHTKSRVVSGNEDASLVDIGDGVLCLEIHSKGNALSPKAVEVFTRAAEELENDWYGLVIGNQKKNFCVGANLGDIAAFIDKKAWVEIESFSKGLQDSMMGLKYAAKPVVATPFGMALGGGAELVMHSYQVAAQSELHMGLVETGVGVVPAAGGCKELLVRAAESCFDHSKLSQLPALKRAWKSIMTGAVSSNAHDAIAKGYLKKTNRVIMNPEAMIDEGKKMVLQIFANGYQRLMPALIPLLGDYGRTAILYELQAMLDGGFITEYDAYIGKKLAYVLSGGNATAGTQVNEQYILDLEREAFLSLCGEEKTRARMAHMLQTGKRLQN